MGKLSNLIKKHLDYINNFQKAQENDYLKATTFNNLYNVRLNIEYINGLLNKINTTPNIFPSNYEFPDSFKEAKELTKNDKFSVITLNSHGYVDGLPDNFIEILNDLEEGMNKDELTKLVNNFKDYKPKMLDEARHPYDDLVKETKKEIDKLDISIEKKKEYSDALDIANKYIVEKQNGDEVDKVIDILSETREKYAKENIEDFLDRNDADSSELMDYVDKDNRTLNFVVTKARPQELLIPLLKNKTSISPDFKNKLLELDKIIDETKLYESLEAGETGNKQYGFNTFFSKAKEVNNLLATHNKLTTNEEKIANLEAISKKTNELEEIVTKYDNVLGYIEKNFDIDKISLPANIYSGRIHDFQDPLKFSPNLIGKWDNEKAPYGVILSGYIQLKETCRQAKIPFEEFLNDPAKAYLKGAKDFVKEEDEFHLIKASEENNLGKRMAHILVMDNRAYSMKMDGYRSLARGIEFLNNVDSFNNETIDNITNSTIHTTLVSVYNHSNFILFGDDEPDYDSIKNLFALGNKTDNLFEVSTHYVDDNFKVGEFAKKYDSEILSLKQVNPVNEIGRIMDTMKSFIDEKNILMANDGEKAVSGGASLGFVEQKPSTAQLFIGSKKYFQDYLVKNNINISSFNSKQQKEILEFLSDPLKAFEKKYNNDLALKNEINSIKKEYKEEWDKEYNRSAIQMNSLFNKTNDERESINRGKDINKILSDNKGGFLQRRFGKKSNEYKAVEKIAKEAFDPKSPSYGDYVSVKAYAQKYIDYKLPHGENENNLDSLSKKKVDFCRSLIDTCNKVEGIDKEMNEPVKEMVLASDDIAFKEKLKEDLNKDLDEVVMVENNDLNNEVKKEME